MGDIVDRLINEAEATIKRRRKSGIICSICGIDDARVFKCLCGHVDNYCKRCAKEHLRNCDLSYCGFCGMTFRKGDIIAKCKIHGDFVHEECMIDHLEESGIKVKDEAEALEFFEEKFEFKGFFERLRK